MRVRAWSLCCVVLAACVGDTPNNPDSGTDAAADVASDTTIDAPPSTWCSKSVHAFCADFDGVSKPGDGWDSTDLQGTGALFLDNTNYTSLPNCLVSSIGAVADAGAAVHGAILARTLPVTKTPAPHTEWDMRVSVGATVPAPVVLVLYQVFFNGTSLVQVAVDSVGWYALVRPGATGGTRYALLATPSSTGWVHFILDITFANTATGLVKLQMTSGDAGATTLIDLTNLQTTTETTPQSVSLVPGVLEPNEPTPAYQARYDDITLDVQ